MSTAAWSRSPSYCIVTPPYFISVSLDASINVRNPGLNSQGVEPITDAIRTHNMQLSSRVHGRHRRSRLNPKAASSPTQNIAAAGLFSVLDQFETQMGATRLQSPAQNPSKSSSNLLQQVLHRSASASSSVVDSPTNPAVPFEPPAKPTYTTTLLAISCPHDNRRGSFPSRGQPS